MNNHKIHPEPLKTSLEPWKTNIEPQKTNLEPWKTIKTDLEKWKTNLNPWKPIKTDMEPWKTNLEPSKLTWSCTGWLWVVQVVTGDSQEKVMIFRDKQTLHHNIYIIIILIIVITIITNSLKSFMLGLVRAVSATPSLRSGSCGTNTDCKYPGSKICVTGFVSRISFREKCAICYQTEINISL